MSSRVLVIEDDPGVADVLHAALTDEGYAVRIASDGRVGLTAAMEYTPELILVDWRMPEMGGDEFLAAYRTSVSMPARLIVMSAANDLPDQSSLNVDGIIAKPFDLDELLKTVGRLVPGDGGEARG